MVASAESRKAVLRAALGLLQLREQPLEVAPLRRWLDSWRGLGVVVEAMERRGWDVSVTRYAEGWRAAFIRRDHATRAWIGKVLTFHPTPWATVRHAAWQVTREPR
jgi:hypothetical protein